jgi:ATP-binding cassette, subfamily B, bacterial
VNSPDIPGLFRITRYFWPYARQYRALMTGSLAALFGEVGLRLMEPWPLKLVFDRLLGTGKGNRLKFLPDFHELSPTALLTYSAIAVVVITGLRALASYWQVVGFAQIANRVLRKVRAQLYRHMQYLSLSFHTKARTGDLVIRCINDVVMLQDVAVTALLPSLAKGLVVAGLIGLMFFLNWKLALIALLVFPLFWLRTFTLSRQMRELAHKQRRQEGAMAATAAESITGIKTIQALSLEEMFAETFSSASEKSFKQDVKGKRLAAILERTVDVIIAVATALVLWFGTRSVLRLEMSGGDLLVFLAYLKSAYRPVQDFAKYTSRIAKASAAGERVIDLLNRVPDVCDLPGAQQAPSLSGSIEFQNVSFHYEPEKQVLRDVRVKIEPGETVVIMGASGSGKSTLASLILRLYDPTSGQILIDGHELREFTIDSLRSQISVVLQDNLLFATTVYDNIRCASPRASADEVYEAARVANAHEFIKALPQGYETVVGERGVTLSHGQRQRIAIARAAIRKASILILDEPTTGLDKPNEEAVLKALAALQAGRTTLFITHDPRQAAHASRILYLEGGEVVENGTHEELLERGGNYASMWNWRGLTREVIGAGPSSQSQQRPGL